MNTISPIRRRSVRAGVAVAAVAAAFGITASGVDFAPSPDDESAATAIEYGLIAANTVQARGITFNLLD